MKPSRPNILYIMPDELRQRALGYRGQDPVLTPAIDRLAAESLELENVFSNYPVCSPHRGMLFTGQYPCTNGVMGNSNSSTRQFMVRLGVATECLPDVLFENGYHCGYVGKWHLDSPEETDAAHLEPRRADGKIWDAFTPVSRRHHFDFWFSYGCCDQHFRPHYWENTNDVKSVQEFPGEWGPALEAERVKKYLRNEHGERPDDQPFFMVWAPNPPHMPFDQVPEQYKELYKDKSVDELLNAPAFMALREAPPELPEAMRRVFDSNLEQARSEVKDYFACVSAIDDYVGQVLQTLEDCGLKDDTLVIFASDHGELLGSHGLLRKGPWYDDSLKIPFLLRWPGVLEPGKRHFLMNTPDIMPTLLSLVDLADTIPSTVEGQDLSSLIRSEQFASEVPAANEAGGLAYYINAAMNTRGVRDIDYFLVVLRNSYDEERPILYDLRRDPDQMRDVAAEQPDVVRRMRELLQVWMQENHDWWLR